MGEKYMFLDFFFRDIEKNGSRDHNQSPSAAARNYLKQGGRHDNRNGRQEWIGSGIVFILHGIKFFLTWRKRRKSEVRNIGREQFRGKKGGKVSEKNRPLNLLEQLIHGQITETVNMWSVDNKYQRVLFVGSNGIFQFFLEWKRELCFAEEKTGNSSAEFVCVTSTR